jgi:hypothetical protein
VPVVLATVAILGASVLQTASAPMGAFVPSDLVAVAVKVSVVPISKKSAADMTVMRDAGRGRDTRSTACCNTRDAEHGNGAAPLLFGRRRNAIAADAKRQREFQPWSSRPLAPVLFNA